MSAPLVTVALCTHNHVHRLQRTLAALQTLAGPPEGWELLVVDNASSDGTAEYLATATWRPAAIEARVVRETSLGLSNARNCAVQMATGEYLLFIDDDETPHTQWLVNHASAMVQHRPDALGGPIDVQFVDGVRPSWLRDELLGFIGKIDHGGAGRWLTAPETPIFGGNFAFHRAAFERIGNFDKGLGRQGTNNIGGEDIEIYDRLLRAGCKVRWVPDALIYHRVESPKLRRSYFLDLHYRQGRSEGARSRGRNSRWPPRYLMPQLARALWVAVARRADAGADASLRAEMNVSYFMGYFAGWARD
jgi:glycosyltransferase involved in cell wall biosynthesis